MFSLGQMNVLIEAILTVLTYVTSPTAEFCLFDQLICAVRVALGVLSSADKRWAQLWTSMHGTSMYVRTGGYLMLYMLLLFVECLFLVTPYIHKLLCLTTGCLSADG